MSESLQAGEEGRVVFNIHLQGPLRLNRARQLPIDSTVLRFSEPGKLRHIVKCAEYCLKNSVEKRPIQTKTPNQTNREVERMFFS